MRRGLLAISLLALIGVVVALTYSTLDRALVSTRSARALETRLLEVRFDEGLEGFGVDVEILNAGEVPADVEFLRLGLAYAGELVASEEWHPGEFRLEPRSSTILSREFASALRVGSLPDTIEDLDAEQWSLRLHLRIRHPMSRDPIMLNQRPTLEEPERVSRR